MENRSEEFLELYKKLENTGRKVYFPEIGEGDNVMGRLIYHPHLKRYKEELNYCRVVRNFITHNPKIGGLCPIIPSSSMIDLIKKVIDRISEPPLAYESSIKRESLVSAAFSDKIIDLLNFMEDNAYTHIPVIEKDALAGVFSHYAVCSYVSDMRLIHIDKEAPLELIKKYLHIDFHRREYFGFVDKSVRLNKVEDMFENNYENNKILAAVFITQGGKPDGYVHGMITPWDLISD